ncbi:CehA/McbA family metallohydrolase [Actinoplanes sp. KI2]|uniref:CehA/McbA family metallohydrolase n=1 Tax=Actinoplanes sp. KI2 TaxID=2983315 RepID=UPI0021D573F3|nr:CehA/McbA family metallohydrolase [Actinoplanes sp. KI2]MCU7725798.1 CehA/McbA family metallohydrolase [Actinoplanes sp. KI2]
MTWYRGDCHVHTQRSHAAELTPPQVASAAREAGLDFIAITEHNAADTYDAWGSDVLVIPGQEVVTSTGHWVAVGLAPGQVVDWRYGVRDGLIERAVESVRRVGGLCIAAHPHAPYPSGVLMYPFRHFDVVEVWNGAWRSDVPWQADNEAALAEWGRGLAADLRAGAWRPAIGNSDVHLEGQIGTPQTVVRAAGLEVSALLAGLRAGHSWIAASASVDLSFTVRAGDQVAGIGERLRAAAAGARVDVSGVPDGVVGFHTERGRAHVARLPGDGAGTVEWSTTAAESGFIRIEVRHPSGGMAALTNPIILT